MVSDWSSDVCSSDLLIYLFIFGCFGSSLLQCGLSLVAVSGGLVAVRGLLIAVASPVAEHGL